MSKITLYHAIPSRGLVVHWMLEELSEPFEIKLLSLADEEQETDAFRALNPLMRVPTLVHGSSVVTETAAILMYLAESFPNAGLDVPVGDPDRGDYLRWMFFGGGSAEPAILWKMLEQWTKDADYQPYADIDLVIETLVGAVEGKRFLLGDRFTAADIMIGSTLNWGLHLVPMLPKHPALTAYWDGLATRPAWQRVWKTVVGSQGR